jgi:hypothetical protein
MDNFGTGKLGKPQDKEQTEESVKLCQDSSKILKTDLGFWILEELFFAHATKNTYNFKRTKMTKGLQLGNT